MLSLALDTSQYVRAFLALSAIVEPARLLAHALAQRLPLPGCASLFVMVIVRGLRFLRRPREAPESKKGDLAASAVAIFHCRQLYNIVCLRTRVRKHEPQSMKIRVVMPSCNARMRDWHMQFWWWCGGCVG